eukprot:gnl/TRDRNA2_/TRDRNA2_199154_c0_seq1.p1 gnl/TRDRNA2_/TRDRNA2_199154_c0~~gnl/TRDRNA2_/TRDRNA2_199154_c0_seq1.p1  ORF type:complete len:323 (-),score=86.48 gnl/TRDRNA2_/TRDRNA2_199154_c0_seq1:132-1100(-)
MASTEGTESDVKDAAPTRKGKTSKQRLLEHVKGLDPDDDERTTISKKISWILRHGAKQAGVPMDSKGWVKIGDLLKCEILDDVEKETLMSVIEASNDQKKRYELKETDDATLIKAYSKDARAKASKASNAASASGTTGTSAMQKLRTDAPEFVPSQVSQMYPMMAAYQWPYYGYAMSPPAPPMAMASAASAGRYRGKIKSFNTEKGFGFIDCPQAHAEYNRDVFVHKSQMGDLQVGAPVSFSVEMNQKGMPQAKDLQPTSGSAGGKGASKGKTQGKGGKAKGGKGESKGKGKGKDSKAAAEKSAEEEAPTAAEEKAAEPAES